MWRRAHGRLAAIVVVAGGLLDCAATPKPVDDEEHGVRMHCGHVPTFEPQQLAAAIEKRARESCGPGATSGARYGEFRAVLHARPETAPMLDLEPSSSLDEDDQRCVQWAKADIVDSREKAWRRSSRVWNSEAEDVVFYVALGSPPPLLPATPEFIDRWLEATRSKPARKQLEGELPAEVALEDDCLTMPARPAFADGLERWLAGVDTPLAELWQPGDGLFSRLEPFGASWKRAFLVADRTMLIHRVPVTNPARQEICLLHLDDKRWEELRASVNRRATCWAGDLREVLLHARTRFPPDHRYQAVAVGKARACAVDERGAPVCCGERLAEDVPAGPFAALAVGGGFDCGLAADGSMTCWGSGPDTGDAVGPFAQIAVSTSAAWAIRSDTGVLECRFAKPPPALATIATDRTIGLMAAGDGPCVLLRDGRIHCWGSDLWRGWSELDGRFNAFAAGGDGICGVTTAGDTIKCWRDRRRWPWRGSLGSVPSIVSRFGDPSGVAPSGGVALSGGDACVLGRSGRISCVPEGRYRWTGVYRAIAGGDRGICAVTTGGRVECDRSWP